MTLKTKNHNVERWNTTRNGFHSAICEEIDSLAVFAHLFDHTVKMSHIPQNSGTDTLYVQRTSSRKHFKAVEYSAYWMLATIRLNILSICKRLLNCTFRTQQTLIARANTDAWFFSHLTSLAVQHISKLHHKTDAVHVE